MPRRHEINAPGASSLPGPRCEEPLRGIKNFFKLWWHDSHWFPTLAFSIRDNLILPAPGNEMKLVFSGYCQGNHAGQQSRAHRLIDFLARVGDWRIPTSYTWLNVGNKRLRLNSLLYIGVPRFGEYHSVPLSQCSAQYNGIVQSHWTSIDLPGCSQGPRISGRDTCRPPTLRYRRGVRFSPYEVFGESVQCTAGLGW